MTDKKRYVDLTPEERKEYHRNKAKEYSKTESSKNTKKLYYELHKHEAHTSVAKYKKERYNEDPEFKARLQKAAKEYYHRNKDEINKKKKETGAQNEANRKWREKHPEEYKEYQRQYAQKKKAERQKKKQEAIERELRDKGLL